MPLAHPTGGDATESPEGPRGDGRPRVGLVLGAGGLVGIAWLLGGLAALKEETGWGPGQVEIVVGTSAGSIVGALAAEAARREAPAEGLGLSDDALAQAAQEVDFDLSGSLAEIGGRRPEFGLPSFGPGSWRLALSTLRSPRTHTPLTVYSALLPSGFLSTEPVRRLIQAQVLSGWSSHPDLWIVACDYATGRRVVFGREGAPKPDLADAVAASCAIPGTYRPVRIEGRRYVDGGMYSTSNLDVLRDRGLDAVICLNPTSTLHVSSGLTPLDTVAGVLRRESGRRLGREAKRLRERGTQVVLIQPTGEDLAVMGVNMMNRSSRRHRAVVELARRTVAQQLRQPETQSLLAALR